MPWFSTHASWRTSTFLIEKNVFIIFLFLSHQIYFIKEKNVYRTQGNKLRNTQLQITTKRNLKKCSFSQHKIYILYYIICINKYIIWYMLWIYFNQVLYGNIIFVRKTMIMNNDNSFMIYCYYEDKTCVSRYLSPLI